MGGEVQTATLAGTGLSEGDVLLGKYRIERALGRGGMGFVVAATHLRLDQPVAIKMLLPQSLAKPEVVARFAREARAAAKISSEHVVRVMDVGELEDGAPFMVMEHLTGRDLAALLDARGPLPAAEAVGYVLQACEALAEAHARGVIHRDLKPANLFLAERPDGTSSIKVLDFGISKSQLAASPELSLTGEDVVMGSPRYMSPEQLRSARDVDRRTDIWSLGVILCELTTGHAPFDATVPSALVAQIVAEPPQTAALPVELAAVVARCLEKDREKRFAGVAELAAAIGPVARRTGAHVSLDRIERASRISSPPAPRIEAPARPLGPATQTGAPPALVITEASFVEAVTKSREDIARAAGPRRSLPWILIALAVAVGAVWWQATRTASVEPTAPVVLPVVVEPEHPPVPAPPAKSEVREEKSERPKPHKVKRDKDPLDVSPY